MFCSKCGKSIVGEAKFCPYCGQPLSSASKRTDNNAENSGDLGQDIKCSYDISNILFGIAALILIIFGIWFVLKVFRNYSYCVDIALWLEDTYRLIAKVVYVSIAVVMCGEYANCIFHMLFGTKTSKTVMFSTACSMFMTALVCSLGKRTLEEISWSSDPDLFRMLYSWVAPYSEFVWPMVIVGVLLIILLFLIAACEPKDN